MSVHTSGDGKKKPSGLVVGCLVVGIFLTAAIGLRKVSNMIDSESSQEAEVSSSETHAARVAVAKTETCPVVSDDWQPYSPPQGDEDWPSWVEIPRCHRIVWCNPDENLVCKEREEAGYAEQCRIGGEARDWTPDGCRIGTASRVRSKTSEPLTSMVYKFQFIG